MPRERDELDEYVDRIVGDLERLPAEVVDALGAGLSLASAPFDYLGGSFRFLEPPYSESGLLRIQLRHWLRMTAFRADLDEVLTRLGRAESPPWSAVRSALRFVQAATPVDG